MWTTHKNTCFFSDFELHKRERLIKTHAFWTFELCPAARLPGCLAARLPGFIVSTILPASSCTACLASRATKDSSTTYSVPNRCKGFRNTSQLSLKRLTSIIRRALPFTDTNWNLAWLPLAFLWLSFGCWLLAVGCWLSAVGCWLLAVGCWLLAVGCWLLAVGC